MADLDLADIQGLIARGYRDLTAARYRLLRISDARLARGWLARLSSIVTRADQRPTQSATQVAFSAGGLRRLGVPEHVLQTFSNEFSAGMITPHRRRALGDVEASAPEHWLWGGPNTPSIDILLALFASDQDALSRQDQGLQAGSGGLDDVLTLESAVDLDGREHFGFADGLSQPTIAGLSDRRDLPSNTIQPGEVILGYPNEYGRYTDRPLLEPVAAAARLPLDAAGSGRADLGRNGSYLVFRQLSQDVHGFWRHLDEAARAHGQADPHRRTWLASKMVGRWPSGAPLVLAPYEDDPSLASANDFMYHYLDELGLNCPIGAHVRRAHPRDSLDPAPGT
ncbi:MAG: peroxidase, partial [Chloroflexota bacterium]|nr:peroxidase [Chloroflexota bacterium]